MSTPFRDVRFEVESSPEPEPAPDAGRHARHPGPRGKRRGPPPPRAPRLDQELRKHFPEASWSSVRELIKSGKVRVDDQLIVARTIRTRLLTIPGRLVNRAGRPTLRLPTGWPWAIWMATVITIW